MAQRRQSGEVAVLVAQLDAKLIEFEIDAADLTLRQKVLRLVDIQHQMGDLGVSIAVSHGLDANSALNRIKGYLIENVGEMIDGRELAIVSGISEYGRRVRELRKEHGYRIFTGASQDSNTDIQLRADQYLLTSIEPDKDSARRWHVANRIRREASGASQKLLLFLIENVGRVVTTEELAYVANTRQYARRVRELRTEDGYAIATRFTGRPELGPGEYMMLDIERVAEPHDRHIPLDVQKEVYSRDENTCRIYSWITSTWTTVDPRILELHHLEHHADQGTNTTDNLAVLCSKCHDEVHAGEHEDKLNCIRASLT